MVIISRLGEVTLPSTPVPFSDQLERWLCSDDPKTVGDLGTVFAQKSFAVTILFLMIFPATPLPTGGVTHVFEAITVILGVEMALGMDTILLPARLKHRQLGAATTQKVLPFLMRRVRWLERFSKPRGAGLITARWFLRLLGIVVIIFALGAGLAPPFSGLDSLPSLGAVALALGIILEDMMVVIIGVVVGSAGILLSVTLGAALFHLLRGLF